MKADSGAFLRPIFSSEHRRDPSATEAFPAAPPWRAFRAAQLDSLAEDATSPDSLLWKHRGRNHEPSPGEVHAVNLALYLHRPILVEGKPGTGKTSLAYAAAERLGLDRPLVWPINSRSTLAQGLYHYDAVARLRDATLKGQSAAEKIGDYIRLGPLGSALYLSTAEKPVVLLIDEIDKSDVDLPNDLLHVFEDGEFEIPELMRESPGTDVWAAGCSKKVPLLHGRVQCRHFPLIIMTSNGERDFPPAFKRRCIRLLIDLPRKIELRRIVKAQLDLDFEDGDPIDQIVDKFLAYRDDTTTRQLATDQLLNALRLIQLKVVPASFESLRDLMVLADLNE